MGAYIFDLDGTLAINKHREHLIKAPVCPKCQGNGEVPVTPEDFHDNWIGEYNRVVRDIDENPTEYWVTCGCPKGRDATFKPNWDEYFRQCVDDEPNMPILWLLLELVQNNVVWIWSARSEDVRSQTLTWLERFLPMARNHLDSILTMRPSGDYTPDEVLKAQWLDNLGALKSQVYAVFDDRDKVVAMWRSKGLTCLQVAPGNF